MVTQRKNYRTSFGFFWKIFLLTTFPIHVWNLLMVFKDMEFINKRTELDDAIGYASYSLIGALVESLILAVVLWLITLPLPKKWSETRTVTVVASVYFVLAGASAIEQAAHAFDQFRISKQFLYGLENFTGLTFGLIIGAILLAIVIMMLLIFKTNRGQEIIAEIYGRLTLLSYLYLIFDLAGIVIVIFRNIPKV